jgi:hypothetical protein
MIHLVFGVMAPLERLRLELEVVLHRCIHEHRRAAAQPTISG